MSEIINERTLLEYLSNSRKTLLIEPNYKTQYYPIGLGKISAYIKLKGGATKYTRGKTNGNIDLICITTLFTNDFEIVLLENIGLKI